MKTSISIFVTTALLTTSVARAEVQIGPGIMLPGEYRLLSHRSLMFKKVLNETKAIRLLKSNLPNSIVIPAHLDPTYSGWLAASQKSDEIVLSLMRKETRGVKSLVGWYKRVR